MSIAYTTRGLRFAPYCTHTLRGTNKGLFSGMQTLETNAGLLHGAQAPCCMLHVISHKCMF
jgi:hypothetical protein